MVIPASVRKKIKKEAENHIDSIDGKSMELTFALEGYRKGAEFGYSLRDEEIKPKSLDDAMEFCNKQKDPDWEKLTHEEKVAKNMIFWMEKYFASHKEARRLDEQMKIAIDILKKLRMEEAIKRILDLEKENK